MSQPFEPRMFVPGPTEVFPEVLEQLARPVFSHRGPESAAVVRSVLDRLRAVFLTRHSCFVALAAASGLMEAAARNLVGKRLLATVCGAFSARQAEVARSCGVPVDVLEVPPGEVIAPDDLERRLGSGRYDVVSIVHSETSTGALNPMPELAEVLRRHEDVLSVVDCVSSLSGAPVRVDDWGIDLAFAGTQKCLALPPGLSVFSVSDRALARAETLPHRGYYFDLLRYRRMAEQDQCPFTTNVTLLAALDFQLGRILEETLEARWRRHAAMASICRERLGGRFALLPDPARATPSESVFRAGDADVQALVDLVREKGKLFGNGYGALKGKTFRIGHMGDHTVDRLEMLLDVLAQVLDR